MDLMCKKMKGMETQQYGLPLTKLERQSSRICGLSTVQTPVVDPIAVGSKRRPKGMATVLTWCPMVLGPCVQHHKSQWLRRRTRGGFRIS